MIFQIISIVCNLIAIILLIICRNLHKKFLKESIHREELLIFLNIVQKYLREEHNDMCKYFKENGDMKSAIEWQYFTDGNDNAINFIKSFVKGRRSIEEYVNDYLERNKNGISR